MQILYRPRIAGFTYPPLDLTRPPGNAEHQQAVRMFWEKTFPEAEESVDVDFEDFHESALLLFHAATHFGLNATFVIDRNAGLESVRALGATAFDPDAPTLLIGTSGGTRDDPLFAQLPDLRLPDPVSVGWANRYYQLKTVCEHAGRPLRVGGFGDVPGPAFQDVMGEMYADGVREFVLKVCAPKYALELVSLPDGLEGAAAVARQVPESIQWASVHMDGRREGLMLQACVPMRHEYRFFVIANRLVCGAGCIEAFTPLDSAGAAFDARTEPVRNQGALESDPARIARYVAFAEAAVAAIAAEAPALTHYGLDVALVDGVPVIVELNPMANLGLYALHLPSLMRAWGGLITPP